MKLIRNLSFVLTLAAFPAMAQQQQPWQGETEGDLGTEEVIIVKERENQLPAASRNYQKVPPQTLSTPKENVPYRFPDFTLEMKPIDPTVRVLTIKTDPPAPYYNRYVKAGLGNYLSTYLDAWFNSGRQASYLYGVELKHRGAARGPVDGGNSGFSNNKIKAHGKYFGKSFTFDSEAYAQRNRYNFYGYNEEALDPEKSDLKQVFQLYGVRLGVVNAETDKFGIGLRGAFDRTSSSLGVVENLGGLDADLRYELSDALGVQLEGDLLLSNYEDITSQSRSLFRLAPAFRFQFEPLRIIAGFNIAHENDTAANADQLHFYPRAEISLRPVENMLARIGVTGNIEPVTYRSLTNENPYLDAQLPLLHSNKTLDFYGDVKGRIAGGFGYLAGFSAATYRNMYYFVNTTLASPDSSRFGILYDQGTSAVINVHAELSYSSTNRFQTSLRADYFGYDTEEVQAAWHKPEFKLEWLANYNLYDKILFTADAFVLGGITAKAIGPTNELTSEEVNLKPVVNLGLGVEYLFSPQASAYLKLDNMLAQEFQRFYNYPSRRIVVSVGGSYAF